MQEIPQKNEALLVAESLPENKEIGQWELFDIVFHWWNDKFPSELFTVINSIDFSRVYIDITDKSSPVELFDMIFDPLNDKFPYKMLEFMACPDGHVRYLDRRGL